MDEGYGEHIYETNYSCIFAKYTKILLIIILYYIQNLKISLNINVHTFSLQIIF